LLFLLRDDQGRALLIAQAGSKNEADAFGRSWLPDFSGESIEIELASRADAEEFWGVRTVRVGLVKPHPGTVAITQIWVRGPKLPEDVEAAGLLTPEDRRDLTLDHIARTSDVVAHLEIRRRS
jgi:hypothetical protein